MRRTLWSLLHLIGAALFVVVMVLRATSPGAATLPSDGIIAADAALTVAMDAKAGELK
jgi:hypothetical protein